MKYYNISIKNDSKRCINAVGSIQSHFRPISEDVRWPKGLWSNISDSVKNLAQILNSVSGFPQNRYHSLVIPLEANWGSKRNTS